MTQLETAITFDPDVCSGRISTQNNWLKGILLKMKTKKHSSASKFLDQSMCAELEKIYITASFKWLYFLALEKRCWRILKHVFFTL